MKKTLVIFILSLVVFSCEKDKQLIIENTGIPLISNVLVDGEVYYEYSYNDANLISEEKSKFYYTRHIYNDKNQLILSDHYVDPGIFSSSMQVLEATLSREEWVNPENTEKSLTTTFEYDGNEQLTRKTFIRPLVSNSEFFEFNCVNGRISRMTMYWKNELSGYIDYQYDEKGNLIKEIKYLVLSAGIPELRTTTEYEYDNMKNPYQSFKRLMTPGKYTNQNNITKETYTIHFEVDPWSENIHVGESSYEYNEQGYPVKVNGNVTYVYK